MDVSISMSTVFQSEKYQFQSEEIQISLGLSKHVGAIVFYASEYFYKSAIYRNKRNKTK